MGYLAMAERISAESKGVDCEMQALRLPNKLWSSNYTIKILYSTEQEYMQS